MHWSVLPVQKKKIFVWPRKIGDRGADRLVTQVFFLNLKIFKNIYIILQRDNVFVKHFLEKMLKDGISLKFKDSKLLRLDHIFW